MGDRTWVQITCHKDDREDVANFFGEPQEEFPEIENHPPKTRTPNNSIIMCYDQVNYGGCCEFEILAKERRIPFIACSGGGDEYGPSMIAAHDGEICVMDGDYSALCPVIRMSGPGVFDESDIVQANRYYALRKRAEERLFHVEQSAKKGGAK
jgi:hypothetical protein